MINEKNNFDSSDMMDESDIKLLNNIGKIKRHLMSFFKMEALVDEIRNNINNSEIVEFNNARSAKFINIEKPLYVIKFNKENALVKYPHRGFNKKDDELQWITNCIHTEILEPFTEFLHKALNNNEELEKTFDEIFNDSEIEVKSALELGRFLVSSIFGIRIDLEANLVHIEYMR